MDAYEFLPKKELKPRGMFSEYFLQLGIKDFYDACIYVHNLPYGYNSDYEDRMILFKENQGSCTSKHAVIATLASEIDLPLYKYVGVYKFTEEITTGTQKILDQYHIPYIPMVHCFLVYSKFRFDLTEGNYNGKKKPIDDFIHIEQVEPFISRKDEYLLYKRVLKEKNLFFSDFKGIPQNIVLKAREDAIKLLKDVIR